MDIKMEIVIMVENRYHNGQYTRTISITGFHKIYLENEYNHQISEKDILDVVDTSVIFDEVDICKEILGKHIKEILNFFNLQLKSNSKKSKKFKTNYSKIQRKKADPIYLNN